MIFEKVFACLLVLCLLGVSPSISAMSDEAINPCVSWSNLKEHHPRCLLDQERVKSIHALVSVDASARDEYAALKERAEEILKEPVSRFKEGGLLEVSRSVLKRIYILSFMYRMEHANRYLERAKSEMLAACSFPNWHPAHFLDTAEMTQALSIGYDWLYDSLSRKDRFKIAHAITELGLKPGLNCQEEGKEFWVKENDSNWCLVCYGALLTGALALGADAGADDRVNREIFSASVFHLRDSLHKFAPDGAWVEGVGYWNYGTIYATTAIACLESALGSDFGVSSASGFGRAGLFFVDCMGPTHRLFNFADAEPTVRNSPQLFWFAHRYQQPVLAYFERQLLRTDNKKIDPRDLIWFDQSGKGDELTNRPLVSIYGGGTQLVTRRNGWHEDCAFVAFKGGDNSSYHAHLELGTFVYDNHGVRWVTQLGVENYELPGYFDNRQSQDSKRWTYYRCATAGQNTVVINKSNQDVKARAFVAKSTSRQFRNEKRLPEPPFVPDGFEAEELNMNDAYKSLGIEHYSRAFALSHKDNDEGSLLVVDTIEGREASSSVWQFHTDADVQLDGQSVLLTASGRSMHVEVLEPGDANLAVNDVSLPKPQYATDGMKRITITPAGSSKNQRFVVLFTSVDKTQLEELHQRIYSCLGRRKALTK
jgi:hypothetical protein